MAGNSVLAHMKHNGGWTPVHGAMDAADQYNHYNQRSHARLSHPHALLLDLRLPSHGAEEHVRDSDAIYVHGRAARAEGGGLGLVERASLRGAGPIGRRLEW